MTDNKQLEILTECWNSLYPDSSIELLKNYIETLQLRKQSVEFDPHTKEWYKDAIVYSVYVDLFNNDFSGLEEKLDYLQELGINCIWLLPILDSPMRDAGFDIRNYREIRKDLLGFSHEPASKEALQVFESFLQKAHQKGIRVIFDIAINHTSNEHPWFLESKSSTDNPYRDYYIWNKDTDKYREARLLFKGMCPSNWERSGDGYFFHRFFEFQPDLNYRNPMVLLEMADNLVFWMEKGVDGFRADALPYLWKEEGTDCENLPQTHTIIKFFRAILELMRPDTLLLAEACQKPVKIVKYLETGEECNAGYHFPLMPQMFKAIAQQSSKPILSTLDAEITPLIPESSQWFTFLRCHDELSLELVYVSEEDRKYIHGNYCHEPEWDFRLGEGISARLAELFLHDERKIGLAFSIMMTLPGTPVIYYGDEFGKLNDKEYYREMISMTGKNDTRFLVRGKIDWDKLEEEMNDHESLTYKVFNRLKKQLNARKQRSAFGRGDIKWRQATDLNGEPLDEILVYERAYKNERILVVQNLSPETRKVNIPDIISTDSYWLENAEELLGQEIITDGSGNTFNLPPYGYYWILL